MASREMIVGNSELTELKANGVKNAIRSLIIEWSDFDGHLDSTQHYFKEKLTEIESREKNLSSIKDSVVESNKELESVRLSVEEKYKQLEFEEEEFRKLREEHLNELELKEEKLDLIRGLMEGRSKEVELREERIGDHEKLVEGLFERLELEMKEFDSIRNSVGGKLEEINLKEMELKSEQKVYEECVKELQAKEKKLEWDKKLFEERQLRLLRHSRILGFTDDIYGPEKESFGVPPDFNSQLSTPNNHHQSSKPDLARIPMESATCINTSRKRVRNSVVESSGSADTEVVVINECNDTRKKLRESTSLVGGKEEQKQEDHLHNNNSKYDNRIRHMENEIKRLEAESTKCREAFDQLKKEEEKAKLEATEVKSREVNLLKEVDELKQQLSYQEGMVQSFMSVFKAMFFKDGWDAGLRARGVPEDSVLFNMHKVPEVVDSPPIRQRDSSEMVPPSEVHASDPHEGPICSCPEKQLESMTPRELNGTNNERRGEFTLSKENVSSCLADERICGKGYSSPKKVSTEVFHDFTRERSPGSPKKVSSEVFHDFSRERSPGKFQPGQIWAMYKDGLPQKFAQIKNKYYSSIPVQLLKPCTVMQPPCCGIFKVQAGRTLHSPGSFSHLVEAKSVCKNFYEIYPKKGEVWAIYRNWKADYSHYHDLENCEYDIVEVLKDIEQSMEVSPLVRVTGFKSVFRASREQRSNAGVLVIPRGKEIGRFSHQIPAFQLTTEKEGTLRGYWELDPAAVPGSPP